MNMNLSHWNVSRWLQGRMRRGSFWWQAVLVWLVFYFLSSLVADRAWGAAVWVINVPVLLVLLALCVRRLHDLNRSGWWLLAVVVPVLGAAWLAWTLAFKAGTADTNRFGAVPGQQAGDFLTV